MVSLEDFYIDFANDNIDYSMILWDRYLENRSEYGVKDEVQGNKLKYLFKQFRDAPLYFKEGIKQVEARGDVEKMDDCVKHLSGLAIASVQSYIPNLINMTAKLCQRDYQCNAQNLFQGGMNAITMFNELKRKLTGIVSLVPPYPVVHFTVIANIVDVFYQTDIVWLLDCLRTLPEIKFGCMMELGRDAKMEDVQRLALCTAELTPQLLLQYTNTANMLSNRPYMNIDHDWGVLILSILEADAEIHEDGAYFRLVDGAGDFTRCLSAQCGKVEGLLEPLKKILEK